MSPQPLLMGPAVAVVPPQPSPCCSEAPVLEAVAAFLAGRGLGRAAEAVREEAARSAAGADAVAAAAARESTASGYDAQAFAAGARQLAALLSEEADRHDGNDGETVCAKACGGKSGKENLGPPSLGAEEVCANGCGGKSGKENLGLPSLGGEEEWLDSILTKLVGPAATCQRGSVVAEELNRVLGDMGTQPSQATAVVNVAPEATAVANVAPEVVAADADPAAAVTTGDQGATAPPDPVPAEPPVPSAHYNPFVPGALLEDGTRDEYRDDADPGYRVLQVSEAELVAELQEKHRSALTTAAATASGSSPEGIGAASPGGAGSLVPAAQAAVASAAEAGAGVGPEAATAGADAPAAAQGAAQAAAAEAAMWVAAAQAQVPGAPRPTDPAAAEQGLEQDPAAAQPQSMRPHVLASARKATRRGGRGPSYCYAPSGDPFYPAECDGVVFDSFPLRVVYERDRTGFEDSKEFPIQVNSIIAARYQVLNYLGSAAFSRAVQCLDLQTGMMVCMKIIKNDKDFIDQSLDEIKLLTIINANTDNVDDKHCLRLIDYIYHKEHLIIITELLRDNLYEFSKFNREHGQEPYFTLGHLQRISRQLLGALEYVHGLWLIHADLKPENILVRSYSRCEVKLIDFGSSCFIDDRLSSYVQSRSYRAPEVILGLPYDQKVDLWSLGCVLAELWTGYVLFQNDSVQSLLARVIGIMGPLPRHMMTAGKYVPQYFTQDGRLYRELGALSPAEAVAPPELQRRIQLLLPKRSSLRQRMRTDDEQFLDFLGQILRVDPAERPSAAEALQHPWLTSGRYSDGL